MNTKPLKKKLETYCEFINGGAWNENEYTDSGVPVLKVSNIKNQTFSLEDIDYLSIEGAKKYVKNLLNEHDLIVATVGSHPNLINSAAGRTISVPKSLHGYLLNQNAVCIRTKDNEVLFQPYLRYIGETVFFRAYIQARGKGAANQMRIAIGEIKSFPINLPELAIQKKIAAILSAYDDLIENNLKRIKLLEEMAQITYEEWFVLLKFPSHETMPMDSETGLPVGWEKTTCFDLMNVLSGGTPKTDIAEYWNGNIKFFTPKDAANCIYTLETEKSITELGLKKCNSKLYPKNTILITARGTVGKLNLAREAMAMNQSCYALIAKNGLSQLFLFCALNNAIGAFKGAANGGVFDAIVVDTFRYISIIKPDEELIGQFHSTIKPIFEQVDNLIKQNQFLKEARDILLPRLMTGMIDVEQLVLPNTLQVEGVTCDEIN